MAWVCTITFVLWLASRVNPWQKIGSAWTVTAVKYCQWCGWLLEWPSPETLTWVNGFVHAWRVSLKWVRLPMALWTAELDHKILQFNGISEQYITVPFCHVHGEWWNSGDGVPGGLLLFLLLLCDTVSKNWFCTVACCYICSVAVTASAIPSICICAILIVHSMAASKKHNQMNTIQHYYTT